MKIVQSYWSKPMRMNDNSDAIYRSKGGWSKKIFFFASWFLSCLKFKQIYGEVELFTDTYGKHLLYDVMELPYSKVYTSLDDLETLDHNLWAIGKIYTYSQQREPFLHVDSDIYIWKKFDEDIISGSLIGQSLEKNYIANIEYFTQIEKDLIYVPDAILEERSATTDIIQINAGILGGTDLDFFKDYTSEALKMVQKNYSKIIKLHPNNKGAFNMVYEQFLAYCMAKEKKINLKTVFETEHSLSSFHQVPQNETYIHPIGTLKKFSNIGDNVIERLSYEFPEYYDRLMMLINKNVI